VQPISEDDEAFLTLLQTQVLTTDRALGKSATPQTVEPATSEILLPRNVFDDLSRPRYSIEPRHRAAFFASVMVARCKLRFLTLEHTVYGVTRRRTDSSTSGPQSGLSATASSSAATRPRSEELSDLDINTLQVLISGYRWLRPWGFAAKNHCLLDSLALLEYLAQFGQFPQWIFGVRSAPFAAHCWAQIGPVVLSDHVDHVGEFTPIMAA
jgi:hypothetical protein